MVINLGKEVSKYTVEKKTRKGPKHKTDILYWKEF